MPPASTNGSNGEGSSHQSSQPESPLLPSVEDENVGLESQDYDLLEDDFLGEDQAQPKRKQKAPSRLSLPKFLAPLPQADNQHSHSVTPPFSSARIRRLREQSTLNASPRSDMSPSPGNGHLTAGIPLSDMKESQGPVEWYAEGPRRRVGYDDLTAIDWIFEYTKERQRLRILYSRATGILGYTRQLLDASEVWLVLIATGLASGVLAAGIDVASDWLGDLKNGYCRNGRGGGRFYLNKAFCCWGLDKGATCSDWTPWSTALHVDNAVGKYIIEYMFFIIYSVVFAVCASALVGYYAAYARQSGIPEIKTVLGGFVIRRFMGFWTLVIKSLGLCLAVASGLWLGKEGPLVHVACCCANLLMKLSSNINDNEARKREVLSAAAAAGISVAFGSPVGGVLFSLEQLSYFFPDKTMWQSFVCAMVAALTLKAFNPFRTEKVVLYQVTYSTGWHNFEMVPFALLGVIGGIYGGLFIKLNMKIAKWRRSSQISKSPIFEVFIVAVITAVINFPNAFMRAQSSELVFTMFAECTAITDDEFFICKTGAAYAGIIIFLLLAAILGFFFASVTFGLQIPAGIILPSMAIGALYGRVLGILMEIWQKNFPDALIFTNCEPDKPCITPGTYAIIGAASALGGVTRMTVSIVVIMFELTGALTYVLPIMIAVMMSKWVGDAFGKKGIYESWINFKEYPFLDQNDDSTIPDVPISEIMTRKEELAILTANGHTIQSLQDFLQANQYRGFPIAADDIGNILLGYISRTELIYALKAAVAAPRQLPPDTEVYFSHQQNAGLQKSLDLRPWMDQTPITLNDKSSLQLTIDMFQKLGLKYVLFCDRGVLQGLLTKKDIWYVLNNPDGGRSEVGAGYPSPGSPSLNRRSEEHGFLGLGTGRSVGGESMTSPVIGGG
ncbi:MAG: hypothetical protein MMC33_002673 [Icmadophila ericetorum]|nr:hypothetical protein [Icmadophila ericetorum]